MSGLLVGELPLAAVTVLLALVVLAAVGRFSKALDEEQNR